MLNANPLMAQNHEFMEDLMKGMQKEAEVQQPFIEEEIKGDPEVIYDKKIIELMGSTLKSR